MRALPAGLMLLAIASSASASPPFDETPRLPETRKPSGADLERYYPSRARDQGISGRAVIECTVTAEGALTACVVVSETPPGAGFGEASIRAATKFRMRPKTVSGESVAGARVKIPLNWSLSDPPAPPAPLPVPTGD